MDPINRRKTKAGRFLAHPVRPVAMLLLSTLGALCFCARPAESSDPALRLVRRAHYLMGTIFEISAYGQDADRAAEAIEEAFAAIREADEMMSDYRQDSDLTRLNESGATALVPVPVELYALLRESVKYSRLTGGAFDVTVGPLVSAWQQAAEPARPLSDKELRRLLPLVGNSHLLFDEQRQAVRFDRPGVRVDLGGIAKGWAVDRAAAILRQYGIERGLISAGSSTLYAIGSPPAQPAWKIGIRHPLQEDEILATVALKDESLSTSASYEKYLRIPGRTYSHLIDPRSGIPVERMLSCTVIAPTALESDALSTGAFVLGMDQAEALLRRLGLSGIVAGAGMRKSELVVRQIHSNSERNIVVLQTVREKR